MGKIEVAVMEPKYQVNLGHIARVSKNFGVRQLFLINPRCKHDGKTAIKYSKHAAELLRKAKLIKSLKRISGNAFVIGTTGIWHKTDRSFYNVYSAGQISRMSGLARKSGRDMIVVLGRDDTGLSKEELRECDATICLSASPEYPILNISHALAIILHSLYGTEKSAANPRIYADGAYLESIFRLFDRKVDSNRKIRDKGSVKMAFRHIMRRSSITRKEANALAIALAP